MRAAEAAEAVHANGEAAALYSRALKLWDRVANAEELAGCDHVELLRAAARATGREHEAGRAETLLRAALSELDERTEPERAAGLLAEVAREQFYQGRSGQAAETRQHALSLLPDEPSPTRAALMARLATELMLESRYREAEDAARAALEVARAAADELSEIRALDTLGVALFGLAPLRRRRGGARRGDPAGRRSRPAAFHALLRELRRFARHGGPARGRAPGRR